MEALKRTHLYYKENPDPAVQYQGTHSLSKRGLYNPLRMNNKYGHFSLACNFQNLMAESVGQWQMSQHTWCLWLSCNCIHDAINGTVKSIGGLLNRCSKCPYLEGCGAVMGILVARIKSNRDDWCHWIEMRFTFIVLLSLVEEMRWTRANKWLSCSAAAEQACLFYWQR